MKILVVDDIGYSRHYHMRLLQKLGYSVETAENGRQALGILERDKTVKVVLTDLMMTGMDGIEFYKQSLHTNRFVDGGSADPPAFLLMTALRQGRDVCQQKGIEKVQTAKEIGFIDVLYKPIEPESLRRILETIKYARGRAQVDTVGLTKRVTETIDHLIEEGQYDNASKLQDDLRNQIERLDRFL
jgi:CheY-like chemotaxis protein